MRQVLLNTGVVVQQTQQAPYPFVLPQQGVSLSAISLGARLNLQVAEAVVGSVTDIANGIATYSSIAAAITYVSGLGAGKIIVLDSQIYVENITVPGNIFIEGVGHNTYIQGTITFSGNYSLVKFLRHQSVTFNASTDGNRITDTWMTSGATVTNSGLAGNYWQITGE